MTAELYCDLITPHCSRHLTKNRKKIDNNYIVWKCLPYYMRMPNSMARVLPESMDLPNIFNFMETDNTLENQNASYFILQ